MKAKNRKVENKQSKFSLDTKYLPAGISTVFYLFCFVILILYKRDFLFRMQDFSLFIPENYFFKSFLRVPGDLLSYIGAFFTQFFYYPFLGIVLFIGFLLAIQQLVNRIYNFKGYVYILSFLPSALLLLFVCRLDYYIYAIYLHDIIYSQVLGVLFTLVSLLLYSKFSNSLLKYLYILLIGIIGYPIAGFYALLGILFIACYTLIHNHDNGKERIIIFLFSLLIVGVIPQLYYYLLYNAINIDYIYIYGLPVLDFVENDALWYPLIAALLVLFLFTIIPLRKNMDSKPLYAFLFNSVGILVIMFSIYFFSYLDVNFHNQLKMERALALRDWDKVLEIAKNESSIPTRTLVMYRNIALHRKNELCDKMFTYPDGAETFNTLSPLTSTMMSAPTIYYYNGKLNFCYRWCMELMVSFGLQNEYLKYMVKIALFNGELQLAQKYNDILKKTLFHQSWAEKYQIYIDTPELFQEDEEFKEIVPLLQYEENGWENNGLAELCLLNHYSSLKSGSRSMYELSTASILTLKSIELFWPKFAGYVKNQEKVRIPTHVQEAALLYAYIEERKEINNLPIDKNLVVRFNEFMAILNRLAGQPEEQVASVLKTSFGNTYWYYYFFVNNITIN